MKTCMRVVSVLVLLGVACVTGFAIYYSAGQQPNRGVALEDLNELFQPQTKPLGVIVLKTYREFRGNAVRWSSVYFGCVFGSAFLSAVAALILKLELLGNRLKVRNDLAALLATFAALLVTLSTTGDFQRKWQANRIAAADMENLAYELTRTSAPANLDAIVTRIQAINSVRNQTIAGTLEGIDGKVPPQAPGPAPPDTEKGEQSTERP